MTLLRCSCIICKKELNLLGLGSHIFKQHTETGQKISKAGNAAAQSFNAARKLEKQNLYSLNPDKCKECQKPLPYKSRKIFCTRSCSGLYHNRDRAINFPEILARQVASLNRTIQRKKDLGVPLTPKQLSKRQAEIQRKESKCLVSFCQICKASIPFKHKKSCSAKCYSALLSKNNRETQHLRFQRRSKDEIKLFELCSTVFTKVDHNIPLVDAWDADIVIHDSKTAILWNGPWHYKEMRGLTHSLKQVQNRDRIKTKKLIEAGWKVLIFEDRYYTPTEAFSEILRISAI